MPRKRLHIVVEGRVQGVGFRYFTHQLGARMKLAGWVRNRGDGSVEVEVEGDAEKLDEFVLQLNRGPALSHVRNLRIDERAVTEQTTSFQIRH